MEEIILKMYGYCKESLKWKNRFCIFEIEFAIELHEFA